MRGLTICLLAISVACVAAPIVPADVAASVSPAAPAMPAAAKKIRGLSRQDVVIDKRLTYDQHTLADSFAYQTGMRGFQWNKIRERLFVLDSIQIVGSRWAILQNRRNKNGQAPNTKVFTTNEYSAIVDRYGVEKRQSVPLYEAGESTPERYGRDGSLVKLLGPSADSTSWRLESYNAPGVWEVPKKYVKPIDTQRFDKVVMVDLTNQIIATLERAGGQRWLVRSMNPCTTGKKQPPHSFATPEGMFVIQDRTARMLYDNGGPAIVGFAPWASRVTNGAFLHGWPVNNPNGAIVEWSPTLGTYPRSHECIRNASSHAKFIYDWAPINGTIVFIYS